MSTSLSLPRDPGLMTGGVPVRRFAAFLIDLFIMGLAGWALAFAIFIFGIFTLGLGFLMFHILPLLPFFYYTILIGGYGATPGQALLGIAVRQDADLALPNHAQALVWSVLMWLSFALACVPFALALVGPRHRAGHDLLSGLVLIRHQRIGY